MVTILVTGCGGAVGLGIVKALRMSSSKLRIVGVEADSYAACFHLRAKGCQLDRTYVVPRASDSLYISRVIDICRKEKIDAIFPGTDAELEKLSTSRVKIASYGTKIIVSPPRTIKIYRDKWLTYYELNKYLPMVKSALPDDGIDNALKFTGTPAIIKPRLGWGSRQTYKVNNLDEAQAVINDVDKPVFQSWLNGEEYTIDGLADRQGKAAYIVPRRRIKVLAGVSFQAVTVRDEKLIELGKKVTERLKIIGPFNFQVKKVNGEPKIFEINPRFAGTGILSVKAGVNIPLMALNEICNVEIPKDLDFVDGLAVSRYFKEIFFKIDEV